MRTSPQKLGAFLFCLLLGASGVAYSKTSDAQTLLSVDIQGFEAAYQQDKPTLPSKKILFIDKTHVEFDRYWQSVHRSKLDARARSTFKRRYGMLLKNSLQKHFSAQSGFVVTDDRSAATLVLTPKIEGLFINAPDFTHGTLKDIYAENLGRATVNLVLQDLTTGETLLEVKDTRQVKTAQMRLEKVNRVINARAFKLKMDSWSSRLGQHLASLVTTYDENPYTQRTTFINTL